MDKTECHIRFHNYDEAAEFYRSLKHGGAEVCIQPSRAKTKELGAARRKIRRTILENGRHRNAYSEWVQHMKIDKASFSIDDNEIFVLLDATINAAGALLLDRQLKKWNCTYFIHIDGRTVVKEMAA